MVIRSLTQTLRATASELAELTSIADHLERVPPTSASAAEVRLSERAQLTVLLTRRLAGLTTFVDALALSAQPGVGLDVGRAAAGVKHREQARRLCGLSPSDVAPDHWSDVPASSGDMAPPEPRVVVALADRRPR